MPVDFAARATAPMPGQAVTCQTCGLVTPDSWTGVPAQILSTLSTRKTIRTFRKGDTFFHEGDEVSALYRLLQGVVLLRKVDHDGNSIVTRMVVPYATFGFRAFATKERHTVTAQCASDVRVCCIPADVAELAFANNRSLERAFAQHVAHELDYAEDAILARMTLSMDDRLLLLFGQLVERFGQPEPDGSWSAEVPVLRRDLAAIVGIARESFSRALARMEAEDLLRFDGPLLRIPSIDKFRQAVTTATARGP